MFLVFDWWLDVFWLKSHRNATYCIDFNIVIRIFNTPVSAKIAQGQRKWRAVLSLTVILTSHLSNITYFRQQQQQNKPINIMKFYLPTLNHLVIQLAKLQIYTLNLTTTFWHCKKNPITFEQECTSEWSWIWLSTKVRLIVEVWRYD